MNVLSTPVATQPRAELVALAVKLEKALAHEHAICAAIPDDFDYDAWFQVVDAAAAPTQAIALEILETSSKNLAEWAILARAHQYVDGYTRQGGPMVVAA